MEGAKINDFQGDYSTAWQRILRETLIEMYNYWTADTACKNDHECCLHKTLKKLEKNRRH